MLKRGVKMGTDYFELEKPITYLKIEDTRGYCKVSIWINHEYSGLLTVRPEELDDIIELFTSEKVVYRIYYGGEQKRAITEKMNETNNPIVISEYGSIVSVKEMNERIKQCGILKE